MKKQFTVKFFIIFTLFFVFSLLSAQEYAYEFGTISKSELEATIYRKAPTAEAVVISDYAYRTIVVATYRPWTRAKFPYIPNRGHARARIYGMFPYTIETTHQQKIKIFNKKGLRKATLKIPFHNNKDPYREEVIDNVEAILHHLNNGKIETVRFNNKDLKTELINDTVSQIVVQFANAQVGDVVEFRYKRTSPLYVGMKNWKFQRDIPVMSALLELFIYDAFQYNMLKKGSYRIAEKNEMIKNAGINDLKQRVFSNRNAIRTIFLTGNLPAWNNDIKFIWNKDDHISGIDFELRSTRFLDYIAYADTWKEVEERIEGETRFNKNVYGKDYFKKEVKALIKNKKTQNEQLDAIYGLIKEKIKWNGKYALSGNVKKAVEKGIGNNAEFNSALIRALKTAKIYVYPVLISPRKEGQFPDNKPTYDGIKTFIVCASLPDGMSYYMDGSAYFGGVNAIPTDLMVNKARTFVRSYDLLEGQSNATVDVSDVSNYELIQNIEITPQNANLLVGKMTTEYKNLYASIYKKRLNRAGRQEELIAETQEAKDSKITDYSVTGNELLSNRIVEDFKFSKNIEPKKEGICFNPLLMADRMKDYSIGAKRVLPIELEALTKRTVRVVIHIPTHYEVETLPQNIEKISADKSIQFSYKVEKENDKVQIQTHFEINKIRIDPNEIDEFREIVKSMEKGINQLIELKKKGI